ncbi:MAG: hypothetical protein GHCLOJNM_03299 [bacterium]|nr:hypothetical protein [bacterium]
MSSLKAIEKTQLEKFLGMESGYVLDFTNRTFQDFVRDVAGIDIYSDEYAVNGDSKAKRFRAFWERESDTTVAKVLSEFLNYWRLQTPNPTPEERVLSEHCHQIIQRLSGQTIASTVSEESFLKMGWGDISLKDATTDHTLLPILESRFEEAKHCLEHKAPLATIFLCGSILEGLLLGTASDNPAVFNSANSSPKDSSTGKVKKFPDWRLAELIEVACEVKFLTLDVKKFSHALRDFRNYIHPHAQRVSEFNPDKHTAEICMQVLKAAVACLSKKKK